MADVDVRPLRGLWRAPNDLASPPGSCETLDNCCIRRAGIIEPFPTASDLSANWTGEDVLKMFDVPGDDILVIYLDGATQKTAWVDKDDGTKTAVTVNSADPTYENGAAHLVRFRDRYYLTSKEGLLCFDSAGDATPRRAGLISPPFWVSATNSTTDAQAITWGFERSYRAVFERKLGDGSLIIGPPSSPRAHAASGGVTSDVTLRVGWENPTADVIAGDYVSLWATDEVANAIPYAGGDTHRLVKRVQLTSSDITNEYVDILDDVPQVNLGVELYTNPGQSGLEKAHFPPPYLRDVVLFKGSMVGIAYKEAYGITLRVPGTLGDTDNTVAERLTGIGSRQITGDTNTSVTISNVSNADHFKGLSVGQVVDHADFPAGTQITTWDAGAQTITVDTPATASNAGQTIGVYDVIEIAGVEYQITSARDPVFESAPGQDSGVVGYADVAIRSNAKGASFSLRAERASYTGTTFGVRATNGDHYVPNIPALADTAKAADDSTQGNRLAWSEPNEPEHWPLVNRDTVGEGEIIRLIVAGDICYIFNDRAEVYAMTGEPDAWRYDRIAENVQLVSAGSVAAYNGSVYAWTDKGIVIFSGGVMSRPLTESRLSEDMKKAFDDYRADETTPFTWRGELAIDRFNKELWLITGREETRSKDEGQPWIYNLETDEFYRLASALYRAPCYVDERNTMYVNWWDSSVWQILYFDEFDSGSRIASTNVVFNRTDLGMGGGLKKYQEAVLHFAPSASGDETFSVTFSADSTTGGASVSTSYTVTLDASDPTVIACHVPRNTGLSVQQRLQIQRTTHAYRWALEGITWRAQVLTNRTGARAA